MDTQPKIGRITVAPDVLETIVRLTALATPGVASLAAPPGVARLLGQNGVRIEVVDSSVHAEVFVVAEPDVNMLRVGRQIQAEVVRAIRDMIGMEVLSVDVYIEDVAYPSWKG
jgi:uncharacterized alkaline shock family protein YloU